MIPDDPIIRFNPKDDPEYSARKRASQNIRRVLHRLHRRVHEVKPPKDWKPLGYEW